MSSAGKILRMSRLFRDDGKTVIVALDHGLLVGPQPGWVDPAPTIEAVLRGGVDAVMTSFGIFQRYANLLGGRTGVILTTPLIEGMLPTLELSVRLGVDAIKVFVATGTSDEASNLTNLWHASIACHDYSMPLLAEMFPRKGEKIPNPSEKETVAKYSRIGAEYGADIIKTFYTGTEASFREVTRSCPVPVIILGGEKTNTDRELMQNIHDAMKAGAAGVAIGRNIWQHKDPEAISRAIVKVVHDNGTVEESLKDLQSD